jgi:methylated-DNA-[protein]-cysteine S-methyltransferase
MDRVDYVLVPSRFGEVAVAWQALEGGPRVRRVFLPRGRSSAERLLRSTFAEARPRTCAPMRTLAARMRRFLEGEPLAFGLEWLEIDEQCSPFQARVLRAEHGIPRGWVSTYTRIARFVGNPRGARAVGMALARNPFPILIPCHRAIQSSGGLGGFQGGVAMKRALLESEGVAFAPDGRARATRIFY